MYNQSKIFKLNFDNYKLINIKLIIIFQYL